MCVTSATPSRSRGTAHRAGGVDSTSAARPTGRTAGFLPPVRVALWHGSTAGRDASRRGHRDCLATHFLWVPSSQEGTMTRRKTPRNAPPPEPATQPAPAPVVAGHEPPAPLAPLEIDLLRLRRAQHLLRAGALGARGRGRRPGGPPRRARRAAPRRGRRRPGWTTRARSMDAGSSTCISVLPVDTVRSVAQLRRSRSRPG